MSLRSNQKVQLLVAFHPKSSVKKCIHVTFAGDTHMVSHGLQTSETSYIEEGGAKF